MGTIKGMEYSDKRFNEDIQENEYYIDDWNDWYTKEEIKEELEEQNYWEEEGNGGHDGVNWSGD